MLRQYLIEHAIMELISARDIDGYILTRFDCKVVERLPEEGPQTAGLLYDRGRFLIRVVDKWFGDLTDAQRVAVMKHEISHFVLKHMSRRNGRDFVIFNIAGDMIINQSIPDLPKDCVELPLGWAKELPAEIYYDKLIKEIKQQSKQGPGNKGKDKGSSKETGIPSQWDTFADNSMSQGADAEAMTDNILRETIKEQLNLGVTSEHLRGLYAGALGEYIDDLTAPPIINWKQAITRFVASLADPQTRMTLKKPDRRNISPFGQKREYLPSLVICIDTSGSVSSELLSEFFSQIALLGRMLSEVDVVIADAEVHDHFVYTNYKMSQLKTKGFGRGGTDFNPAVRYINKNLRDKDGAIYLTDGWCPSPETKCCIPLIWVVTDNEGFKGRPKIMAKTRSKE